MNNLTTGHERGCMGNYDYRDCDCSAALTRAKLPSKPKLRKPAKRNTLTICAQC